MRSVLMMMKVLPVFWMTLVWEWLTGVWLPALLTSLMLDSTETLSSSHGMTAG